MDRRFMSRTSAWTWGEVEIKLTWRSLALEMSDLVKLGRAGGWGRTSPAVLRFEHKEGGCHDDVAFGHGAQCLVPFV
jgi:hypothetical protein